MNSKNNLELTAESIDFETSYLNSDSEYNVETEENKEEGIFPIGLPPLPYPLNIILPKIPAHCRQAMVAAATVPYGTLATGIRMKYRLDAKPTAFNFGAIVIGLPASGKSFYKYPFETILAPLINQDAIAAKEHQDWAMACRMAKNKQQQPTPPQSVQRRTAVDITSPCFAYKCTQSQTLGNKHLYMLNDEIRNVITQQKDKKFIKTVLVHAFDNGEWSQERVSAEAVTAQADIYLNYLFAGTPDVVEELIDTNEIADGLASRIIPILIPSTDTPPEWGEFSQEEKDKIYASSARLMTQEGRIYCPWVDNAIKEWLEKRGERSFAKLKYGVSFLRRTAITAWKAGYLWAVMEGIAKDTDDAASTGSDKEAANVEYTLWMADYILANQEMMFREKVKWLESRTGAYSIPSTSIVKRIYKELPQIFTKEEVKSLQLKYNSHRDTTKVLSDWRRKKEITDLSEGKYQKIC